MATTLKFGNLKNVELVFDTVDEAIIVAGVLTDLNKLVDKTKTCCSEEHPQPRKIKRHKKRKYTKRLYTHRCTICGATFKAATEKRVVCGPSCRGRLMSRERWPNSVPAMTV